MMFDKKNNKFTDKTGKKYDIAEIALVSDFTLKKPIINETKLLTKDEQEVVEFALKKNGRRLVHSELKHIKNDYKHDFDKGTVEFTSKARNYSYHKIVIPNGSVIKEMNFTQRIPHTDAIQGENITFIDCNLTNVLWHSSWINQGTNNTQVRRKLLRVENDAFDGDGNKLKGYKKMVVSLQVEEDPKNKPNVFVEVEVKEDNILEEYVENVLRKYEGM